MAWGTIRKATEEDIERLENAAVRFLARHERHLGHTQMVYINAVWEVDEALDWYENQHQGYGDYTYYRRLWRAVMRRALREPNADGIAYGYVGYQAD